jgi:hypothetical protein
MKGVWDRQECTYYVHKRMGIHGVCQDIWGLSCKDDKFSFLQYVLINILWVDHLGRFHLSDD